MSPGRDGLSAKSVVVQVQKCTFNIRGKLGNDEVSSE